MPSIVKTFGINKVRYITFAVILLAVLFASASFAIYSHNNSDKHQSFETACPASSEDLNTIVIFGQSNSANYGGLINSGLEDGALSYAANAIVLDWRTGDCFEARDPLPGADGNGGSIWSRFASIRPDNRYLFVTLGAGGTTIGNWTGETVPAQEGHQDLPDRLQMVSQHLIDHGYMVDAVFFQQGESDTETSYEAYKSSLHLLAMQVERLFEAPLLVAMSTLCQRPELPNVREAITSYMADNPNVFPGPDMDRIAAHTLDRTDQCHLSVTGIEKMAHAWAESLETL